MAESPRSEPSPAAIHAADEARSERIEILKLVLADVEKERDRLRNARASFTTRLGPLPASITAAIGIVASATGKVAWPFAAAAALLFACSLWISVRYGGLAPYRELRDGCQASFDQGFKRGVSSYPFRRNETDLAEWLSKKIDLEQKICGNLSDPRMDWRIPHEARTLRDGLAAERAAANRVQTLFVLMAAVLIVGLAVH